MPQGCFPHNNEMNDFHHSIDFENHLFRFRSGARDMNAIFEKRYDVAVH